jgi:beta-lactamase class A
MKKQMKKYFLLISLLCTISLLSVISYAQDIPIGMAAKDCEAPYPLLAKNIILQKKLEEKIKRTKWNSLIQKKQLAISIVDLSVKKRAIYAGVNDDVMLYSASLPKFVALFAYAQKARDGLLPWTPEAQKRLSNMINKSSNVDATWAVRQVDVDYMSELLRRPGYCFYGTRHGGLWLGRIYGKDAKKVRRDPLRNISHGATSRQVARFFTLLDRGLLVGPRGNTRILQAMSSPQIRHKFVKGLQGRSHKILARKSGTWKTYHSDSILVERSDGTRYAAVGLANHKDGGIALKELISILDDLIASGEHRPKI